MNGMQNMFGQQYAGLGSHTGNGFSPDPNLGSMDSDMMPHGQTQTIDQMINQNNQEMMRRRQTYNPSRQQEPLRDHARRSSMLEFSSNGNGELADFQFDPNPQHAVLSDHVANMNLMYPQKPLDPRRVRSREDLTLDTGFSPMHNYNTAMSAYPGGMIPNTAMSMDVSPNFLSQNMDYGQDYDMAGTNSGSVSMTPNTIQQQQQQHQQQQHHHQQSQPQGQQHQQEAMYMTSPMAANFPTDFQSVSHDPGGGNISPASNQMSRASQSNASNNSSPHKYMGKLQSHIRRTPMMPSPLSLSAQNSMNSNGQPSPTHASSAANATLQSTATPQQSRSRRASMDVQSPYVNQQNNEMQTDMNPQNPVLPQIPKSRWSNAYSTTGFDMLAVLMRVATRPNPQINIGPVDLACAFVVCDIQKHDLPIIYCSDMFERLTGYSRHEILGRNCRFLQAPDGKVQSGIKRKYVDDKSILYLKNQINRRAEAQLSLINYRKGGQPFMNLLTMIPITWDTEEFKYFVGFQVDLVEQPNSVSAKNPDGTYEINYNRSALPAYRLPDPPNPGNGLELGGQTISRDEVSQVLATIGNGETDLSRRIWDKVLLENTDDVVHVLSLKGLFLYLSPACKTVLEYEPSELVGTALSAVCHPSDIVPVTRELKDSSNGSSVNVVYRIRRKDSGYTWFEAHGTLHTEQGKGRKCIILVGRQRPVYALDRNSITINEGAGDAELWTKISTSGLFLYVSSSSRALLDRLPDDLMGTSMQALMRPESRVEFGRVLEVAHMGEKATFKHDMQNRRGQVLQAQTTVYPGNAREGSKPTFLLTQTRLLKMTRAMLLNQKSSSNIPRSDVSMGSGTPMSNMPAATEPGILSRQNSMNAGVQVTSNTFRGESGILTQAGSAGFPLGSQDEALASEDNIFDELKTTRSTSWQFELRQMEKQNRLLSEELLTLLSRKKKRKRRKGMGNLEKDCANCHTRVTPEWRRGPSGQRDLCNSCGLRWAKLNGRVSPRKSGQSEKSPSSPNNAVTGAGQTTSNPSNSKESSTETKPTPASMGNSGHMNEGSNMQSNMRQSQMKQELDDREIGNMPPMIEEGQEPPHPNVLPA